jgi:hypothetical protein
LLCNTKSCNGGTIAPGKVHLLKGLTVSRAFKQRTITRTGSRPECVEGRTDDFRKGSHRRSKLEGCLALLHLEDAPVKASVIRSPVLVFAKGVVVRTDVTKAQKLASAAMHTGVTNTVPPTFTALPMPVVAIPTIPNPGVIVAEPHVAVAATPICFEVVAEPPVAVAATPNCFEVVTATTQNRVARVMSP